MTDPTEFYTPNREQASNDHKIVTESDCILAIGSLLAQDITVKVCFQLPYDTNDRARVLEEITQLKKHPDFEEQDLYDLLSGVSDEISSLKKANYVIEVAGQQYHQAAQQEYNGSQLLKTISVDKDGVREREERYFKDRTLESIAEFNSDGTYKKRMSFYHNGQRCYQAEFGKNNIKCDEQEWYEDGKLSSSAAYDAEGKPTNSATNGLDGKHLVEFDAEGELVKALKAVTKTGFFTNKIEVVDVTKEEKQRITVSKMADNFDTLQKDGLILAPEKKPGGLWYM